MFDKGEGEVILLTHGSGRSISDWQEGFADHLARSHRVVAFDNYGFGFSDRNHSLEYGNALWARQAIDVLDALGIEQAVILGHSAGGVVAAMLAADRPDRIKAAIFVGHGMALDPVQIVPLLPGVGELWVSQMRTFGTPFTERDMKRQLASYRIQGTRIALLTFIRRQYTIDGIRLLGGTYEDINVPVLQVHGSQDQSIPVPAARSLTPRIQNVQFIEIQASGHDVHIDAAVSLADEVSAFIGRIEAD